MAVDFEVGKLAGCRSVVDKAWQVDSDRSDVGCDHSVGDFDHLVWQVVAAVGKAFEVVLGVAADADETGKLAMLVAEELAAVGTLIAMLAVVCSVVGSDFVARSGAERQQAVHRPVALGTSVPERRASCSTAPYAPVVFLEYCSGHVTAHHVGTYKVVYDSDRSGVVVNIGHFHFQKRTGQLVPTDQLIRALARCFDRESRSYSCCRFPSTYRTSCSEF